MSILAVFIAATLAGAMSAYYVRTAHLVENFYIERDRTRDKSNFVLQSIHRQISEKLGDVIKEEFVQVGGLNATADELVEKLNSLGSSLTIDEHYSAKLEYAGIENVKNVLQTGTAVVTVKEEIYKDGQLVGIYYEDIEFYTIGTSALTTLKMFDYAYFAYNYGHLYPSGNTKIIINGSVHSNGEFDIDNTVINGFISASNGVNVTNSRIWPYRTYQAKVKGEYQEEVLTQVRPTNPTRTNENVSTGIKWIGGYEPVEPLIGTYPNLPPTPVEDGVRTEEPEKGKGKYAYPDTPEPKKGEGEYAYTKVDEPKKGEGEYAYPDTPEPKKGEGEFAYAVTDEPKKGEGKYAYPDDPEPIKGQGKYAYTSAPEPKKGEGKYAYPTDPEPKKGEGKYAYPTTPEPKKGEGNYKHSAEPIKGQGEYAYPTTSEPKKGEGDYAHGTEPVKGEGKYAYTYKYVVVPTKRVGDYAYPTKPKEKSEGIGKNKKYWWTYTNLKGETFTSEKTSKKTSSPYQALYEADCDAQDAAWQAAYDEWKEHGGKLPTDKEEKDALYESDHAAWVADCAAKDAAWQKAHDAWKKARDDKDAAWKKAHDAWEADCKAKDEAWQNAHDAWQKARDDKDALYEKEHAAWVAARKAKDDEWQRDHDAWVAAGGDDRPAKDALWQKDHDAWLKARADLDALWQKDHDEWEKAKKADREAKDKAYEEAHKAWEDARKAVDDAWQEAHDYWVASGGSSIASVAEQDAKWQAAHDAWQKARDDKDAEWKKAYDAWVAGEATYEKQHEAYLKYLEEYDAWTKGRDSWLEGERQAIRDGTREVDITSDACTAMTNRIIVTNAVSIPMPDISPTPENIAKYKKYCREYVVSTNKTGGTLTCWNIEEDGSRIVLTNICQRRTTFRGEGAIYGNQILAVEREHPRKLAQVKIVNGCEYGAGFSGYPFEYESSTVFASSSLKEMEKNSVVLIGTVKSPIEIDGPVFVDGDVLIRGIVRGRGSIYASRNIHIIGDLIYENPPAWPAKYMTDKSMGPDAVATANMSKDLLSLIAMKSIVVGDYTSANWQSTTNMQYLTAYNKNDGGKKVNITLVDDDWEKYVTGNGIKSKGIALGLKISLDRCLSSDQIQRTFPALWSQKLGVDDMYESTRGLVFAVNHVTATVSVDDSRKYYETVLGNYLVSSFQPSTPPRSLRDLIFRVKQKEADEIHTDAHFITQIDAILYANNGVIGEVGGENYHHFALNGAIICEDECLFPSFNSRYGEADGATPTIWLNWDLRIRSDSKGGLRVGMQEDYRDDGGSVRIGARVSGLRQAQ